MVEQIRSEDVGTVSLGEVCMSDNVARASEYRARAEDLEKRAARSGAIRTELLYLARQFQRLAEDLEASSSFTNPLTQNEGLAGWHNSVAYQKLS